LKAAFCTGKHAVEVREVDVPSPGAGEALVRVRACGICGTDLHAYNGAFPSMANARRGMSSAARWRRWERGFALLGR
jgi:threonine dehydrogenase-like Zn-dependent dehydrogenase